jgi:hypothetical protein
MCWEGCWVHHLRWQSGEGLGAVKEAGVWDQGVHAA